jgi:hypothetical protein
MAGNETPFAVAFDEKLWKREVAAGYRELLVLALKSRGGGAGDEALGDGESGGADLPAELRFAGMLMRRVRYFTDGFAIGGRSFVEEVFAGCRGHFGSKRRTGARMVRNAGKTTSAELWAARDLDSSVR